MENEMNTEVIHFMLRFFETHCPNDKELNTANDTACPYHPFLFMRHLKIYCHWSFSGNINIKYVSKITQIFPD